MSQTLTNWLGALLLALGMAIVQSDVPDHSQEMTQALNQETANRIEDEIAQSQRADYEQCKEQFGENVGVDYRPDGSHRCTLKNGKRFKSEITVAVKVGL